MSMRSMFRYMDPMRGIKWMLGRTDEESWRGKKVVIVFGSAAPMSPGASARLGEWIRDAGYETLDLSSYLPTDPDSVDAALKELAETEQDGVVVMTADAPLVSSLHSHGVQIMGIVTPADETFPIEPPKLPNVKSITVKSSPASICSALARLIGKIEKLPPVGLQVADGEGGIEMPEKCVYTPLVHKLRKRKPTLVCLHAIADNLLYRSFEEKYLRLYAGNPRFDEVLERYPEALQLLKLFGFVHHPEGTDPPNQYVHPGPDNLDAEGLKKAIAVLETYLDAADAADN